MTWTEPTTPQAQEMAQQRDQLNFICWDLVCGKVDEHHPLYEMLVSSGVTAEDLSDIRKHPIHYDIFGVNFYPWAAQRIAVDESNVVHAMPVPRNGRLLADVLRRSHTHTQLPLFVTETSAREDVAGRAEWMNETISAVAETLTEGIPVLGYTWFPLITMIDWEYRSGKGPVSDYLLNLGLWDSNFDDRGTLVRQETPLVEKYRSYIRQGSPMLHSPY